MSLYTIVPLSLDYSDYNIDPHCESHQCHEMDPCLKIVTCDLGKGLLWATNICILILSNWIDVSWYTPIFGVPPPLYACRSR